MYAFDLLWSCYLVQTITERCIVLPEASSKPPPLLNCTYNVSSNGVFFAGSAACSFVLPPANAFMPKSVNVTSSHFSQCQKNFNSTVCEMEGVCSLSDQLSCLLEICNVAANSNPRQNQANLDVYTVCFTALFRSLGMPPNMTLVLITTADWFEYCLKENNNYQDCIYSYSEICFSRDLPGSTKDCLMALPVLCGMFEDDSAQQQECASIVDMVLRETLSSMCRQSSNQETCVSA